MSRSHSPPKPDAWHGVQAGLARCKAAYQSGDYLQAEALLLDIVAFAPEEARAWAWLGQVWKKLGNSEADRAFSRARSLLEQRRTRHAASLPLARLLWQQGDQAEALNMLQRLVQSGELKPDAAAAYQRRWKEQFK